MASSYSTDLKLELMVTGEKAGLWGDITNTNLNILQQAVSGREAVSVNATDAVTLAFTEELSSTKPVDTTFSSEVIEKALAFTEELSSDKPVDTTFSSEVIKRALSEIAVVFELIKLILLEILLELVII